ncbi:hypothetical protein LUZ60_010930 [Juncus effusus]|nr:hypothetical protein LUZ60_010930 [Juncus effusus]
MAALVSKEPRLLNSIQDLISHPIKSLNLLLNAQKSHAQILKSSLFTSQIHLLHSYINCGAFSLARKLFDEIPYFDVVSATSILTTFSRHNRHRDVISMFSQLLATDIKPNEFTFSTVLHSTIAICDLKLGNQIHGRVKKMGLCSNLFVGNSLLNLYAKLGCVQEAESTFEDIYEPNVVTYTILISGYFKNKMFCEAHKLFDKMPERNVVSWNSMIGRSSQMGFNEEAVNYFVKMIKEGFYPDEFTFPSVFTASANITALGIGKMFHACAIKYLGSKINNIFVANSLINFYAKCGNLDDSILIFDKLKERDRNTVTWNSLICGYAQNGKGKEAIKIYEKMRDLGVKTDEITLHALLFACNHAGLVNDGFALFNLVKKEQPEIVKTEHYACVIDLFSRAKQFDRAKKFLEEVGFEKGLGFWKSLIGGCQIHLGKEMSEFVVRKMRDLGLKDSSDFVILSNILCANGKWDEASEIRREIRERGIKKNTGFSWIEIGNKIHVFSNGFCTHVNREDIYVILDILNVQLGFIEKI